MTGPNDRSEPPAPPQPRGNARLFGRRRSLQTPTEALYPQEAPPPPAMPNSERRPILSALSGAFSLALVASLVALAAVSLARRTLNAPGPLASDKVIFIAPGTEVVQIIDKLEKEKVIANPTLLKASLWVHRKWRLVKAGEYLFKAHVSQNDVIDTLVSGKQLLHSVTIPEGLTSLQIVERLRGNEILAGEIAVVPTEGTLLPETYRVTRGMSRTALLRKMQQEQERLLDRIWAKRSKRIPLKSKYEMLTLAAIIEKETGRADERSRVAAVFYNRLRKGMRLQSDPTIVYGLVGGKGTLGRPIQRDEIRRPTPYNTYVISGLPPGPIANPGRASLEAAANPSQTDDLFFVANGTGGHSFAQTLADHNRNVSRWRQIERERAAAAKEKPEAAPDAASGTAPDVDRVAPEEEAETPASGKRGRGASLNGNPFGGLEPGPTGADMRKAAIAMLRERLRSAYGARDERTSGQALAYAPPRNDPAESGAPARKAIVVAMDPPPSRNAQPAPAQPESAASSRSSPEVASAASAKGAPAGAGPAGRGAFAVGPGVESLNLQIIGVTPDVTDSPLDGPMSEEDDPPSVDPSRIASVPMSPAKRADLAARAAKYTGGDRPSAAQPEGVSAAPDDGRKRTRTAGLPRAKRLVYDASEGTRYDPLKQKGWDLNAAHAIPNIR